MFKIATEADILSALEKCMTARLTVGSLHNLKLLTEHELAKKNPEYRVSPQRLKQLALKSNIISLRVECRETKKMRQPLKGCPVCGCKLKRIRNLTVYGGTVTLGYICPNCRYWTGLKRRVPTRYIFTLKRDKIFASQ